MWVGGAEKSVSMKDIDLAIGIILSSVNTYCTLLI